LRKKTFKIVITGDVGAGKTAFINAISEIAVVNTDRPVSDEFKSLKADTTVAMDFGRLTIDEGLVLHLYGTPGQVRFDFMWEILSTGMLGFIVLFDSCRPETCWNTRRIIDFFEAVGDVPYVIVANKQDGRNALAPRDVGYILALDPKAGDSVLPCVATNKEDVKRVLLALFEKMTGVDDDG
jgi:small GTP-binding protein